MYLVRSRYMDVEGQPFIMEILNDVTNSFILESNVNDQIGIIINTYNKMIINDSLTNVYNRRFLDEHFVPSLDCCFDDKNTLNVAFLDINHFKEINDLYGHLTGDYMLKYFAEFWHNKFNHHEKNNERLVVRYGGDEFLIITTNQPFEEFKEEIQKYSLEMNKKFLVSNNKTINFDFSYGLASSSEDQSKLIDWKSILEKADERMYKNKLYKVK
jgi:two-component system cell cycle response regulator